MSRLHPDGAGIQVRPSTAVVEALLEVAKIRDFRDTWLAAADVTTIINQVFGLPRAAKISKTHLLGKFLLMLRTVIKFLEMRH